MFKVGDEVVCVDDDPHKELQQKAVQEIHLDGLEKNKIYHIRWSGFVSGSTLPHVRLVEIFRDVLVITEEEPAFFAFRFAYVKKSEQKTDITIFENMLGPKKLKVTKKVLIPEEV